VLLAATIRGVDLPATAAAIGRASPVAVLIAFAIVIVDISLRALRWQVLLRAIPSPSGPPPYRRAFGYLTIGYVANVVLPARLGDLARVYLAGTAFDRPRLAIFGTLVIERVADGLTMLVLALVAGLAVAASSELRDLVLLGVVLSAAGAVAGISVWVALARTRLGSTRLGTIAGNAVARVTAGARALQSPRTAAGVLGLTFTLAFTSTLIAWTVASAVGISLSPIEAVLFLSGVALSLAIPAGPAAIGTFEFVGVSILSGLGHRPELALATVLLLRLVTYLPPILGGVGSLWALHVRTDALVPPALGEAER
jgi:uncharacterized membrane protein YbhN (UPF0104 family)